MAAFRAFHRAFPRPLDAHPTFFLSNRTFSTTFHSPASCTAIPLVPSSPFSFLASKPPLRSASVLRTFVPTALLRPVHLRTYIRPHYYNNGHNPLSSALRRNRNPLIRLWRRLDDTNPNTVIWFMIGVNLGVFAAWQYAVGSLRQFRDPQWLNFMNDNFVVGPANIGEGRLHTLITSAFSHVELPHLGVNMIVLYSIGSAVIQTLGTTRFLGLYIASGISASLGHLGYHQFIRPVLASKQGLSKADPFSGSLGASGSLMGITTFFACAFPHARFLFFFIVPMPAYALVAMVAAYDLYKAVTVSSGRIDSAGHIGGALYGLGYYFLRVKPMLRAGRWRL